MIDLAVLILSIAGFIVMAGGLVLITYIAYKTLK